VLHLGEINDGQRAAWCRPTAICDEDRGAATRLAPFPQDRQAPELACAVAQVKLGELQLRRPRRWGASWLACGLWDRPQPDGFWQPHRPTSPKGGLNVLKTLVAYRPIDPGSERRGSANLDLSGACHPWYPSSGVHCRNDVFPLT